MKYLRLWTLAAWIVAATVAQADVTGPISPLGGGGGTTLPAFSGDCTTPGGSAVLTCTKTNGVPTPTFATTSAETAASVTPTNFIYEPYDLRRYGGVGDGSTDNTAAINTWVSVCQQSGVAYLYPGSYNTTGNHSITAACSMIGRGGANWISAQPQFVLTANATNMFNYNGLNAAGPTIKGVKIEGIVFNGNTKTTSDGLIALQGMTITTIRDVGIHNSVGPAIRMRQFWDSEFDNVMFRGDDAHAFGPGVLDFDNRYNSDQNQNENNIAIRRCHFEGNFGTYIYADPGSNLFLLRIHETKFEAGAGSLSGGPFPLMNLKQGDSAIITDNSFVNFRNALGYDRTFKFGDTTGASSYTGYYISGNAFRGYDSSTYYTDTEVSSTGVFINNIQDDTTQGLVVSTSNRANKFEYPVRSSISADLSAGISKAQDSFVGFIGVDRLGNTGAGVISQNANSLSVTGDVIVSPASASSLLVSLPMNTFSGLQGTLRVNVRCFSASGAGTISLQYNLTTSTAQACPITSFGTITFDIPQSALTALTTSGGGLFQLATGAANAEAVTLDGVYFQLEPDCDLSTASRAGICVTRSATTGNVTDVTIGNTGSSPTIHISGGTLTFPGGGANITNGGRVTATSYAANGSNPGGAAIALMGTNIVSYGGGIGAAGTKFTAAGTGCTVGTTTGGSTAGTFALAAGPCTSVAVTMNGATGATAPTGWTCQAHDRTAPTVLIGGESSSAPTTATFTIPAGAGATDVISFSCTAF